MFGFNSKVIPEYFQNENNMEYNNNLHHRLFNKYKFVSNNLENSILKKNECNLMELGLNNQVFKQSPNINRINSAKKKK